MITIGDHINPIIVKEVRQAARSRAFVVLVVLTLLACLLITLNAVARHRQSGDPSASQEVFFALYFCLCVVGFLAVPFVAHRSLAREQEDGAWELLQLTGLGPRRILLGKLASSLVYGALFTLLVTPFLVFSYLPGGIALANMIGLAIYGAALTGALSVWTLFTAAVPVTRAQRTGMQILTLLSLTFAIGVAYEIARELVRNDAFIMGAVSHGPELWLGVLTGAAVLVGGCSILFEAAVSRVSLSTEPYARAPRIQVAVATLGIMGLGFLRSRILPGVDLPLEAAIVSALLAFAAALGFAADADRPRARGAAEMALLRPGAVWGLRYTVVLLVIPTIFWLVLSPDHYNAAAIVAAPSYVLIYVSAGLLLCRGFSRFRKLAAPDIVRGVTVVLVLFCGILPPAVTELSHSSASLWAALPSATLEIGQLGGALTRERAMAAGVVVLMAAVLTIAADRLLVARARRG